MRLMSSLKTVLKNNSQDKNLKKDPKNIVI